MNQAPHTLATALFLVTLLMGCVPAEKPEVVIEPPVLPLPEGYALIQPDKAAQLIQAEPRLQIIDCRFDHEFTNGRLPGAHLANAFRPEDTRERLSALDRSKPVLVYCELGGRARIIAPVMHELGFKEVYLLDGGLHAWRKSGVPLPTP